ncbi:MAG: phenylacetate--CoA ligase family protein [Victivallales bacterium]|nr:phenylacetate--CoA ligase family protein [Victivallales bacterium]
MSFFSNCKEKLFFFRYELVKPGSKRFFEQLQKDQYLSSDEIEALNWSRTQSLVKHAFEHVPYYRRRFTEAGCTPKDIKNQDDFNRLPVLTRKDLMDNFDELLSDDVSLKDVRLSTTGGSSGTPAKVYHPKKEIRAANGWRMLGWWGISPAADCASVYRDVQNSLKARIMHFLQWYPTKQILLDATSFTEQDMRDFLDDFIRVRPEVLHGYVGAMDNLAEYVLEHDIHLPPPKVIWVTSAPITPVQQNKIETAFNAPVYDQYGCCEIYWLAAECPARNGLHMFYDTRRIEFLDDDNRTVPNGTFGNIAVTDLKNYAFPLIRYLNGDRGRRLDKRCTCGCNLPLMDKVKGRVSETFTLPSKTRLNGEFLTTLFDNTPEAVKQFQVHQLADASIVIRVIPNNSYPSLDETLEHVRSALENAVHGEVAVKMERVAEIPLQKGKMKFVISDYKA